ncbi:PatB family C-S lyase [uncultured Paraglaciecola sp.]|uniref:MalY/PatB family protein n=1 Tax=uncultured Paraglaciecola sp. TaxID=1765024 RepID=UPI0030DB7833|tara:strand:+ start:7593 stop:8720 length:1128 start_codon:yes stop_codon:yes gene_type:complete
MQFDKIIDRTPTYALKWAKYKDRNILPMWIADTEFRCAEPILDALKERTEHGLMGYTLPADHVTANQAVVDWLARQYDWHIKTDWIVWTPGVVPAFNVACKALCQPGDKVLIQTPNYPPLIAAPKLNNLIKVDIGTVEVEGRWTIDFDELEKQAADPKCKLFIICNPMNPVGSVLSAEELQRIAEICLSNNVMLCSDEIHCDIILDEDAKHLPAGKLADFKGQAITLMAASKTFNVAGLGTSFAIIEDAAIRHKFNSAAKGIVPWVTVLGLTATQAAFTQCDNWHQELLTYLRGNRDYLVAEIASIDGLQLLTPQATFLAWIDASGLGLDNPQKYFEDKGIGPSPGIDFGDKNFVRINFGCPRSQLEQAIALLKA